MTKPENPPLFEVLPFYEDDGTTRYEVTTKITLRDIFAGRIVAQLMTADAAASLIREKSVDDDLCIAAAKSAYGMANAMLTVRAAFPFEKTPDSPE